MYRGFPIGVNSYVTSCKVARSIAFRAVKGTSTAPYRCKDVPHAIGFFQKCRARGGRLVEVYDINESE